MANEILLSKARELVKQKMEVYNDPSHDYLHVERVFRSATKLAESEGCDLLVTQLAALFHDLHDHKYTSKVTTSEQELTDLMKEHNVEQDQIDTVICIMKNTSFSLEKNLRSSGGWTEWHENCKELHCVQDADRLDASGAFGIMRVGAFSGASNRVLFDPSNPSSTLIAHCEEKLLLLKDTMKTPLGKKVAAKRHVIMQSLYDQTHSEYNLEDFC
eukprot:TRINITY_DN1175_c0_g1_i1.p1 TRINITY_DN1175_c0_g1~~TRINITY_DN1175_c0_g1_i1.p1  ORF type:complete len:249 (-),score=17.52 TRINITY_DN1175_c0_g1_i1:12-656(-)